MAKEEVQLNYALPRAFHTRLKLAATLRGTSIKQFLIDALQRAIDETLTEHGLD